MPFWDNIKQILDAIAYFGGLAIGAMFLFILFALIYGIVKAVFGVDVE